MTHDPQLEPELRTRPLPRDILVARAQADSQQVEVDATVQPWVDKIVASCRSALDTLVSLHHELADSTDLDLDAQIRWVAIWEVTGHCIALGHALLDQVEDGHTAELDATTRALVEALTLALALAGGDEHLVQRWLRGKYVSSKAAAAARQRLYERAAAELNRQGMAVELEPTYRAGRIELAAMGFDTGKGAVDLLGEIAARVSGNVASAAHNTRGSVEQNVSRSLRLFSYRRHPDARVRLRAAVSTAAHIETAVIEVGAALGRIVGMESLRTRILAAERLIDGVLKDVPDF